MQDLSSKKSNNSFLTLMSHRKPTSKSLPRQKTIHSGWLWKKGMISSQLTNERWFEIKGDQLFYFKAKGDDISLGQIPLAGNEVHKVSSDAKNKYFFQLVAGEERKGRPVTENFDTLLFAASSPYELEEWIKAINRVIYSPVGGGMFGRPIKETMQIDSRRGAGMVPIIVELCVEYIRKHGLKEEGIFRIPGAQEEVDNLKNKFNTGSIKEIEDGKYKVAIVASVLKKYLGDLPQSVIPPENYDQFIAVGGLFKEDFDEALKKFKPVLADLPKAHFDLLKYLCRFLHEMQLYHKETKMTVENLAVVFAPNFLRPKNEDPAMLLKFLAEANTTTIALIKCQEMLFPVTDDETYFDPNASSQVSDLIDFDSSDLSPRPVIQKCLSQIVPQFLMSEPITAEKRSLSDSSLVDLVIENERTKGISSSPSSTKDDLNKLKKEMNALKSNYEDKISELERKLDVEKKVQEMLLMRLKDEQKARESVEDRLEIYNAGIAEYCRKFGQVDISLP